MRYILVCTLWSQSYRKAVGCRGRKSDIIGGEMGHFFVYDMVNRQGIAMLPDDVK